MTTENLVNFKKVAILAALRAGGLLKRYLGKVNQIKYKTHSINLVTEADHNSEKLILQMIKSVFPWHSFLAEETGEIKNKSEYKWIIDPLDGTTNFAHGFPVFCVSIALEKQKEVILGVIYNPNLEELFTAVRNQGAFLNKKRISVSRTGKLSQSLLATGFPYDLHFTQETNLEHFANFALRSRAIRRAGSAALDLAYLACGRFDGFWELKLSAWDVAAGILLIQEAGGKITNFEGEKFDIYQPNLIASNGLIHSQMLKIIRQKNYSSDKRFLTSSSILSMRKGLTK